MGTSTDGILFYGVDFGEEEGPWGDAYGFEDMVRERYGLDWKGFDKFPVEPVIYCSGDYPMLGLAVRGSVTTVRRGDCKDVGQSLTPPCDGIEEFAAELAKLGIETDGKRSWKLVSYWG